jgi:hypothetical protein
MDAVGVSSRGSLLFRIADGDVSVHCVNSGGGGSRVKIEFPGMESRVIARVETALSMDGVAAMQRMAYLFALWDLAGDAWDKKNVVCTKLVEGLYSQDELCECVVRDTCSVCDRCRIAWSARSGRAYDVSRCNVESERFSGASVQSIRSPFGTGASVFGGGGSVFGTTGSVFGTCGGVASTAKTPSM